MGPSIHLTLSGVDVDGEGAVHTEGMNVADAAYHTAHGYPGGIAALATRMGVNFGTLTNKVNPSNTTHHLSLAEAVAMQELSGDVAILKAMAARLGYTCTRITPDQSGGDLLAATCELNVTHADVVRALMDPLRHGDYVTGNEVRRADHCVRENVAALDHALAALRGLMRPAPKAGES